MNVFQSLKNLFRPSMINTGSVLENSKQVAGSNAKNPPSKIDHNINNLVAAARFFLGKDVQNLEDINNKGYDIAFKTKGSRNVGTEVYLIKKNLWKFRKNRFTHFDPKKSEDDSNNIKYNNLISKIFGKREVRLPDRTPQEQGEFESSCL